MTDIIFDFDEFEDFLDTLENHKKSSKYDDIKISYFIKNGSVNKIIEYIKDDLIEEGDSESLISGQIIR